MLTFSPFHVFSIWKFSPKFFIFSIANGLASDAVVLLMKIHGYNCLGEERFRSGSLSLLDNLKDLVEGRFSLWRALFLASPAGKTALISSNAFSSFSPPEEVPASAIFQLLSLKQSNAQCGV